MDDLKTAIKIVITRIKELKVQLKSQEIDKKELGIYDDCGEHYREQVARTEQSIDELINIKIKLERLRKSKKL